MGQDVKDCSRVCPLPPGPLKDLNRHLRPRTMMMAFGLSFILVATNLVVLLPRPLLYLDPMKKEVHVLGTPHAAIVIDGDANFSDTALLEGWEGDGSPEDPFLISGLSIETEGLCIGIFNTTNHFVIMDCDLTRDQPFDFQYSYDWEIGVQLANVTNAAVENNEFSGWQNGILLDSVTNCRISKNWMQHCRNGILLQSVCNIALLSNTFTDVGDGIRSYECSNCTVANNTFPYSGWMMSHGINSRGADGCIFDNNTMSTGIYLSYGSNSRISRNMVNASIRLYGSMSCQLEQNNIRSGEVVFVESQNCTLRNNTVHDSLWGVQLENSTDCLIVGNLVYNIAYVGIYLRSSDSNSVVNNTCSSDDIGISIYASSYNIVANNTCNSNRIGIYLVYPCGYSNIVTNNTCWGNTEHDIIQGFEAEEVRIDRLRTLGGWFSIIGFIGFVGVILYGAMWRMVKIWKVESRRES